MLTFLKMKLNRHFCLFRTEVGAFKDSKLSLRDEEGESRGKKTEIESSQEAFIAGLVEEVMYLGILLE